MKSPRILGWLVLSSLFIAGNWLCFIWGVTNDRILETSLGYYINPLISVFFGYCFLGERLTRYQMLAVLIAAAAVSMQMFLLGKLPWVAFVLALCFAFYGLIRKRMSYSQIWCLNTFQATSLSASVPALTPSLKQIPCTTSASSLKPLNLRQPF
ncbi:EamA family transporter [Endozoicomonas atrinae]|uniref:EamA family transporter n=1 Tax=Endozoicomonas atrinae TaxID=1333660 RepID=UPI003B00BE72